jgi:hypothetical protein
MEIKNTIGEEKEKYQEQKENEKKIKILISYFKIKKKLIDSVAKLNRSLDKGETKN